MALRKGNAKFLGVGAQLSKRTGDLFFQNCWPVTSIDIFSFLLLRLRISENKSALKKKKKIEKREVLSYCNPNRFDNFSYAK